MAAVDAPVLIWGESGTGKELVAHAVHRHSARAGAPFVPINCAGLSPTLVQSELFGYERGAFTGAAREKCGLIESAQGGSVFLDEIGDLPMEMQAMMLRFLQEGTLYRVGGTQPRVVDVRIIAASHVNLEQAVARGAFRQDLFFRLNVLMLEVPALRQRKEDLPQLAQHFFDRYAAERAPQLRGYSRAAVAAMQAHDWPGNVRELINRVRRALVMAEGRLIGAADLGQPAVGTAPMASVEFNGAPASPVASAPVPRRGGARVGVERHAIEAALRGGKSVTQLAFELGVSRMTLYRQMAKHGIDAQAARCRDK
jgi:DNA-binding NtrC family response regulator